MEYRMEYVAKFEPDGPGFVVTFPAFPEANTGGASEAEALRNAMEALELVVLTYVKDGRELPTANEAWPATNGTVRLVRIQLSAVVLAKLAFISEFRKSGLTQSEFARRIGRGETEVRRMLDPYHATKLATVEQGLRVLGKMLVLTVEDYPVRAA